MRSANTARDLLGSEGASSFQGELLSLALRLAFLPRVLVCYHQWLVLGGQLDSKATNLGLLRMLPGSTKGHHPLLLGSDTKQMQSELREDI